MQVTFNTFREQLLLNENMQPFLMNFILYSTYSYEILMVATSFLAALLPAFIIVGYLFTRKPGFCRALIMYLVAKTVFWMTNNLEFTAWSSQTYYVCTGPQRKLVEGVGLCEQSFLISVFFTYMVLSTLLSMNNCICRNVIQRMNFSFYGMMVGSCFIFALYLSKLHLQQNKQTAVITSIELGMGFAAVFLMLMVVFNMWPIRMATCFESLPEEELLLNHLCLKWNISTEL